MSDQLKLAADFPSEPFPASDSERSVRSNVDALIDWYEKYNPAVRTVAVNCAPATLRKFCKKNGVRGGPWLYREREIIPMRKSRAEYYACASRDTAGIVRDEMQQYGTPGEDH